jgi:peptidoglycan/LPS O-acetylase OafA/YrhL
MSYCVNCGVELADSEKSCPLCNVAVNNPVKPWSEPPTRPYPSRMDKVITQLNRNFGVGLASLFLIIPSAISLAADFFADAFISWSFYVIGACLLAYVFVIFPLLFKSPRPYLFLALDFLALAAYLAMIDSFDGYSWFLPLALPLASISAAFALGAIIAVRQKRLAPLNRSGVIFLLVSALCVAIDIVVNLFAGRGFQMIWSPYASAPCIVFSVALFYTERHAALKARLQKRLFY